MHIPVTISGNTITAVVFIVLLLTSVTLVTLSPQLHVLTSNTSSYSNTIHHNSNTNKNYSSASPTTDVSVFSANSKPYNLSYGERTTRLWHVIYFPNVIWRILVVLHLLVIIIGHFCRSLLLGLPNDLLRNDSKFF